VTILPPFFLQQYNSHHQLEDGDQMEVHQHLELRFSSALEAIVPYGFHPLSSVFEYGIVAANIRIFKRTPKPMNQVLTHTNVQLVRVAMCIIPSFASQKEAAILLPPVYGYMRDEIFPVTCRSCGISYSCM
jgi:hypothetical protein